MWRQLPQFPPRSTFWHIAAFLTMAGTAGLAHAQGAVMFSGGATGEKPQSKIFRHDGTYWAVLEGPGGVAFHELVGDSWRRGDFPDAILAPSGQADVRWNGTDLFVLLYRSTARLFEYGYESRSHSWQLKPGFPVPLPTPEGSETMVLEQDSTGRLWVTAEGAGNIQVYYSTSHDHRSWSSTAIVLESGVDDDDISSIVAFGGDEVGVFWSDQRRGRFGFRVHRDGDPPEDWGALETIEVLAGNVDDHVNLAHDSRGRIFAITKDSSDEMAVHRRDAAGHWTSVWNILGASGTRGIIMVSDDAERLYALYTRWDVSPYRIELLEASPDELSFGNRMTFLGGSESINNVTGTKDALPAGQVVAIASGSSNTYWNSLGLQGAEYPPPVPPEDPPGGPREGPPELLNVALDTEQDHVQLAWSPAPGSPNGYNVYRQVSGGSFARLNAAIITGTSFTDASAPMGLLCYYVEAEHSGKTSASDSLCVEKLAAPAPTQSVRLTAYPNPFNPLVHIRVSIPDRRWVNLVVLDARGQLIARLLRGEQDPGETIVHWEGRAETGSVVGSGAYFLLLEAEDERVLQRIILVK